MGLKAAFEMDTVSCQNSEVRMADQKIVYIVVNTGLRFLSYVDGGLNRFLTHSRAAFHTPEKNLPLEAMCR